MMNNGKNQVPQPLKSGVAKVPVILQMESVECGAAALDMILAYYHRYVPLEVIRTECGVSRDGSNLQSMYLVAQQYGLEPKAFRYTVEGLQQNGTYPCIIHWNFCHFVVLDGFRHGKAVLNDPARGLVEIPMDDFAKSYTGICLFLAPSDAFEPGGAPISIWNFAGKQLKGAASIFVLALLSTAVITVAGILLPGFGNFFVENMLTGSLLVPTSRFYLLFGITALLQLLATWCKAAYMLTLEGRLGISANISFVWHILCLPVEFYEQRMVGDVLERQKTNSTIASTMIKRMMPLIFDGATVIFYLAVMIRFHFGLALVSAAAVLLNVFISNRLAKRRLNNTRVMAKSSAKMNSALLYGISMIDTVKAAGVEKRFFDSWAADYAEYNERAVKNAGLNQTLGILPGFLTMLSSVIVTCYGAELIRRGQWNAGILLAFNSYLAACNSPATSFMNSLQALQEMLTDVERIHDVMHSETDVDPFATPIDVLADMEVPGGKLEMKDVVFGYNHLKPPLLDHFSLTVDEGEFIAIVGSSGCGKTTVSRLITGLYKPWSGEILLDGKPIGSYPREIVSACIGYVSQQVTLFETTVEENLNLLNSEMEFQSVVTAAKEADIHDHLVSLPQGYNTRIVNQGSGFSGGQQQRLDIARAIAAEPKILILDEATAGLDAETEHRVMSNIRRRKMSILVISHRLSIIRDCDRIIVMQNGVIIDSGRHGELMQRCAAYRDMIASN